MVSLEEILPKLKLYTAVYLWKYRKTSNQRMGLIQNLIEVAMSDNSVPGRPPRIWVDRTQAMYLPAWLVDASIVAKAERTTPDGTKPVPSCLWSTVLLSHKCVWSGTCYRDLAEFVRCILVVLNRYSSIRDETGTFQVHFVRRRLRR